jgi:hypothetical protein
MRRYVPFAKQWRCCLSFPFQLALSSRPSELNTSSILYLPSIPRHYCKLSGLHLDCLRYIVSSMSNRPQEIHGDPSIGPGLCAKCKAIFTTENEWTCDDGELLFEKTFYHMDGAELLESSRDGCYICRRILEEHEVDWSQESQIHCTLKPISSDRLFLTFCLGGDLAEGESCLLCVAVTGERISYS